jgi:response regulator RpfG family c-di-GMP phosphodiesterase
MRTASSNGIRQGWNDLLLTCCRSLEELRSDYHQALVDPTEATLFALAQAVEQRDLSTGGHCERLAFLSVALGIVCGLGRRELLSVYRGAYLHDIGKVGIPDSILLKPGRLDPGEWEIMKTHPLRGVEICRHLRSLDPVIPIIRHHHERWDGSGYPDGLAGRSIPLPARIVQLADIYDALRTERPYKRAFTSEETIGIIDEETARGWRDPALVQIFHPLDREVLSRWHELARSEWELEPIRESLSRLRHALAAKGGAQSLVGGDRDLPVPA